MLKTYEQFEQHEHNFNVLFATSLATIISLGIGGWLATKNFFNNSATWFIVAILVAVPLIVFIATSKDSELKVAYYKTWRDKLTGILDQYKILERFARQYKISDWRMKIDSIEVDGRWNFHADTNYMHKLANQRDLILSQLKQEYQTIFADQNKILIEADRNVKAAEINCAAAQKQVEDTSRALNKAKTSAAAFQLSQDYTASISRLNSYELAKNDALHRLNQLRQDQEKLTNNYNSMFYRITQIYYGRYVKYTEKAIRKINQINGLKYSIVDMPKSEV